MNSWLHNFAYRIELNPWMFAIPGLITFGSAIILVTVLTYFSATRNPNECLRHE
jgi:putative ABC transport system permease protein